MLKKIRRKVLIRNIHVCIHRTNEQSVNRKAYHDERSRRFFIMFLIITFFLIIHVQFNIKHIHTVNKTLKLWWLIRVYISLSTIILLTLNARNL